jgi:hypothetical protein
MVLLSTRNIKLNGPVNKLNPKYLSPYRVAAVPNSHSCRLDLPHELSSQRIPRQPPTAFTRRPTPRSTEPTTPTYNYLTIDSDDEALWVVEAIKHSLRTKATGFEYLIKWRGYEQTRWEPLANVVGARALIIEFERLYKGKLRPTKKELQSATMQHQEIE